MRANFLHGGVRLSAALLVLIGLFLLGILLTPAAQPVQAAGQINAPASPAGVRTDSARTAGTLASFTALIPQISPAQAPIIVNLPVILR
jgi:hypothetical protein